MSWPMPGGVASGPILPAVPLPWASRDSRPTPVIIVPFSKPPSSRKVSVRKVRYGVAMAAGFVVVRMARNILNRIPLVNIVSRPVFELLPPILAGPALGAAVLYGIEQGDILAARHLVREKAEEARKELDVIVQDVSSEIQAHGPEIARQGQAAFQTASRAVVSSVEELERAVLPVAEREYRRLEAHTRQAIEDARNEDAQRRTWAGRDA